MKEDRDAFKVGSFVFLSLLIFLAVMIWKSQLALSLTGKRVNIVFQNANGILAGSDVRYRGYTVGKVLAIQPELDHIMVRVILQQKTKISKAVYAKILFDGIVGESYVTLVPEGNDPNLLSSGDTIQGENSFGLANFIDVGTANLQELKEVIVSLKETFQDDEVSGSVKSVMVNISELSLTLNRVVKEFKSLSINQDLAVLIENLTEITDQLKEGIDEEFIENSAKTFENLSLLTEDIYTFLNESDFKEDLSKAVKRGANFAEKSDNVLEKITNIELDAGLNYDFSFENEMYNYHLMFDFWLQDNFFRLGLGNRTKTDEVVSIQQSIALNDYLRARFGYFYQQPGIGFDYTMNQWLLELDLYDFKNFYTDFAVSYPLSETIRVRAGMQYLDQKKSSFFGGVSIFR